MSKSPLLAALSAVLLLAGPVRSAGVTDARALLEQVGATYRGCRTEMRHPLMGMQMVSDGRKTAIWTAQSNQYTRRAALPAPQDSVGSAAPQGSPLARYFRPTMGLRSAEMVGEQAFGVGDAKVPCWVVRAEYLPPGAMAFDTTARATTTLWIDQSRSVVLRDSTNMSMQGGGRSMEMVQISAFSLSLTDQALPDSLFAFTPPAGAKEVEDFQAPGQPPRPDLTGEKAPNFTLTDLKGRTHSLAAYRGRIVVLDFWATWCKPCRIEMPRIQKLYSELKAKGLVVLGVNVGESATQVRPFIAKNGYTFPILLDTRSEVAEKYQADAIPTLVVIDRDGMIKAYFQGVREEDVLREAIRKAEL
ncbi:MAG: TlpA family protein disulfide reductase [Candidatus Eisenbacteria bacterium]|nr:TlpA family protein disulfide reductase [Candidatus Eisenbacteria bacterium]